MKAVILGATKGMGRAVARQAAQRGDTLFLLGRNTDDLARSAADCTAHGPAHEVGFAACDLAEDVHAQYGVEDEDDGEDGEDLDDLPDLEEVN